MSSFAYVTLLTSDFYLPGAIVLAKSLDESGTTYDKVILVTPDSLTSQTIPILTRHYTHVIPVQPIVTKPYDSENLQLLGRPDLFSTLTKLNVWNTNLLKYERVAFLDADTLVIQNIDRIFGYLDNENLIFAAAPDVGWPDCFNSGVFVTKPSKTLFDDLIAFSNIGSSFDGADQGLLNGYFSNWSRENLTSSSPKTSRLPFTFNVTPSAFYSYLPAIKAFGKDIRVVHFIGDLKPWHWSRFSNGGLIPRPGVSENTIELISKWWDLFDKYNVHEEMKSYRNLGRDWSYYQPPQRGGMVDTLAQSLNRTFLDFSGYKAHWNEYEVRRYAQNVPKNTYVIHPIRQLPSSSKRQTPLAKQTIDTKIKSRIHDKDILVMDFATHDEALLTPSATDTLIRMHPSQVLDLSSTPVASGPSPDFEAYRVKWKSEEIRSLPSSVKSSENGDDERDDLGGDLAKQASPPATPPRNETASDGRDPKPDNVFVGPSSILSSSSPLRQSIKTKEFTISKDGRIEYHFNQ